MQGLLRGCKLDNSTFKQLAHHCRRPLRWHTRLPALCLIIVSWCFAGVAYAQTFASVQDAVAGLPELSMLNQNTNAIALADKLRDPNFVGTLFAPTNAVSRCSAAGSL